MKVTSEAVLHHIGLWQEAETALKTAERHGDGDAILYYNRDMNEILAYMHFGGVSAEVFRDMVEVLARGRNDRDVILRLRAHQYLDIIETLGNAYGNALPMKDIENIVEDVTAYWEATGREGFVYEDIVLEASVIEKEGKEDE